MKTYVYNILGLIVFLLAVGACTESPRQAKKNPRLVSVTEIRPIVVQPFDGFSSEMADFIYQRIKKINPDAVLALPMPLPAEAYNADMNCYRADILIDFLKKKLELKNGVILGLTSQNLSRIDEYGQEKAAMGLATFPGNACVVSVYQLTGRGIDEQLYRLTMHELGHTEGLPHCHQYRSCFMYEKLLRNALWLKTDFCPSCKLYLVLKGWEL